MIASTKNKALRLLVALTMLAGLFRLIAMPACVRVQGDRIDRIETVIENYSTWFKDCKHVLLDLGANRGDTILRWFTEEKFTGRAIFSFLSLMNELDFLQIFIFS